MREGEEEIEKEREREMCVYYCWGMGEDICMYLMFLVSIIILCFVLSSAFMVTMRHQVIPNMAFLSSTTE